MASARSDPLLFVLLSADDDVEEAHAFHEKSLTTNPDLVPRTLTDFRRIADDEQLFGVREQPSEELVAL